MMGDFNIRDNLWNSLYSYYLSYNDNLFIISDAYDLGLFFPTNQVPTRYSDNCQEVNSVLDLMFLYFGSDELDHHVIYSDWRLTSDYAPLTITISIVEEHI